MRVGMKLVREHKAAAFVTAGNTGAAMATAKMVLGALAGVDRPALAVVLRRWSKANPAFCLTSVANVDCKPANLEQFAVMGELYAQERTQDERPRRGVLSIGEEEGQGQRPPGEAFPCSSACP